jgi:hypothetical protein
MCCIVLKCFYLCVIKAGNKGSRFRKQPPENSDPWLKYSHEITHNR